MISTKGRYALRMMVDLAIYAKEDYVTLKEISHRENISIKYLEQVVSLLTKAGLLQSLRGNNGGYKLSKPAKQYTAGEILRAAEGSLAPIQCLQAPTNLCKRVNMCSTIEFWQGYYDTIIEYVDGITLEDLANKALERQGNKYNI